MTEIDPRLPSLSNKAPNSACRRLMICDLCLGKGWSVHPPPGVFPDPCRICGGAGRLTIGAIARLLRETPKTLSRIYYDETRLRQTTVFRILDKINALLAA